MAEERASLQHIVVETTTRCNLRCVHCMVREENNLGNYVASNLPMELFHKLLPMLQDFRPIVQLSGHGETLLHPNFMEMLEKVIRAGCRVTFQTNGTILTPRKVEKIVRPGVETITISIDAASPELFEKIRRGARLGKILENIRLINEAKKRLGTGRPQLGFEFVAMRQNIHELPTVVRMAGEQEVVNFQVAELTELSLTRGQSLVNNPLMAEYVLEAEAQARKWGINLLLPPYIAGRGLADSASNVVASDPRPATYKGLRKTCKEPWRQMFMRFSGNVRPCCTISESYGDLRVQSLEEIWFGPKYEALRTALLTDEPFAVCVHCRFYGWEPIDSRESHAITNSIRGTVPGVEVRAVSPKNSVVDERDQYVANLEALVREKEAALNHIYKSHGWRALLIYYKVRDKIFPVDSRRRKVAKFVSNFLREEVVQPRSYSEKTMLQHKPKPLNTGLARLPGRPVTQSNVTPEREESMSGIIDPKEFIRAQSVSDFCRAAEDFFKTVIAPNPAPHTAKPFTDFTNSPNTLYKLGLLLGGLKMGRSMVVLDFGAGTCWLSRFLNQMGCATISVDPSETALNIGRRLYREFPIIGEYVRSPQFLLIDGHRINLEDSSVDRIICFDTFHHIPNQEEILREFFRVLNRRGIVGFSEPGLYHSQSPQAQYEMKTYHVLENDIHLDRIKELSEQIGFEKCYTKLLVHPEFDIEYDDYAAIVSKGKFPEKVLGHIAHSMRYDNVFFLLKNEYYLDSRCCTGLKYNISAEEEKYHTKAGEPIAVKLKIRNTGPAIWLHSNMNNIGVVFIGTHLYDAHHRLLNRDFFGRTGFDSDIFSGKEVEKTITLSFSERGKFLVAVDLVSELVCWFEQAGNNPVLLSMTVS